jgi:hypothetical protein
MGDNLVPMRTAENKRTLHPDRTPFEPINRLLNDESLGEFRTGIGVWGSPGAGEIGLSIKDETIIGSRNYAAADMFSR